MPPNSGEKREPVVELDAKGIPLKSSYPESPPVPILYSIFTIVLGVVGLALAYFTSYFSEAKRAAADAKIAVLSQHDLGWLYLGIFLITILQLPIAMILGSARKASRAAVPDQHVYRVMGAEGSRLGYVLMEAEGVHGVFNRAQRAWQNYHEAAATVMLQYVAASWVWPFEAFACAVLWAVSTCLSAWGYVKSPGGRMKGRLLGYAALATLRGMILIAGYKALAGMAS